MELCKTFVAGYHAYFKTVCPEESREDGDKALLKFAAGLSSRKRRESILKDAQSIAPLSLTAFDRDKFVINCQNGTFDLQTMTLKPHNAADFITKLSRAKYVKDAKCERWERFIDEIMCGDAEAARFLQKALGYALSGDTSLECFFILYGNTTRNGKSTLTETAAYLLGDYARTIQPQTLSRRTSDGASPSPDIARLKGARLVNMPEPEKGLELNIALIKQLTGGDTYTARNLHENHFEFPPEFKIFIHTNHLPRAEDDTVFTSGRVKIVPFDRHFEPNEQDTGLKKFFRKYGSLSGIFNWLLQGYKLLQSEGLDVPARITAAIEEYRRGSGGGDAISAFIGEVLEARNGGRLATSEVYAAYTDWAARRQYPAISNRAFVMELRHRCNIRRDGAVGNVLVGFAIKSEVD
jgi:putative DNA primase/helicase